MLEFKAHPQFQRDSDKDLVNVFKETENHAAFETLIARHKELLVAMAAKYRTTFVFDIEDAIMDTVGKVFKSLKNFKNTDATVVSWMVTILYNSITNDYRKNKKRQDAAGSLKRFNKSCSDTPYTVLAEKEFMRELEKNIEGQSATSRKIWELRYLRGFKYVEIAAALDMPEGTVKGSLFFIHKSQASLIKRALSN